MARRGFLKKTLCALSLEFCTLFALPLEYFALPPRKNRSFKLHSDTCFRWNLQFNSESQGILLFNESKQKLRQTPPNAGTQRARVGLPVLMYERPDLVIVAVQ